MRIPLLLLLLSACTSEPIAIRVVVEHVGSPVIALDSGLLQPTSAGADVVLTGGPSERLSVLIQVGDLLVATPPEGVALVVGDVSDTLLVFALEEGNVLAVDTLGSDLLSVEIVDLAGEWHIRANRSVVGLVATTSVSNPWFVAGESASEALVAFAGGDPVPLEVWTEERTGLSTPLASPTWAVGASEDAFFVVGEAASAGLQGLAEDGSGERLAGELEAQDWTDAGFQPAPDGDYGERSVFPGERFVLEMLAMPGDRLHMAWMFANSNDTFFGLSDALIVDEEGVIQLGELGSVLLYDAGTEVNEPLGIGPTQAPRQSAPNEGTDEDGVVSLASEAGFPAVSSMVRVTVEAGVAN